jgi:predicted Zn-dependent protease
MRVGIVNEYTTEKYKTIGGHELGHVLGWYGHSALTTQLMHSSANNLTNTTVSTQDKYHIKQFYDLYY